MAKSSRMGGDPNSRTTNILSRERLTGPGAYRANSTVRAESYLNNPVVSPVSRLKDYVGPPSKVGLEKPKNIPRSYVPSRIKQIFDPTPFATPVVKKPPAKKPVAAKKPAPQVVSNVTNAKMSPTKTAPARMAVNPRTGNTTGFTTGKTTGTSVSKSGVATKTYQSAYDRQRANAMNRTNQPAGPTGGGSSSRSSTSGGSSRTSGGGNLGGARGRISEPGGSKR